MTNSRAGVDLRTYVHQEDYERVNRFLVDAYEPGDAMAAWLQPRWEYMHFHPNVDDVDLSRIAIAHRGGEMLGLIHPEHSMASVYLQARPGQYEAADLLIEHALANFGGRSKTLARDVLGIYCSDSDPEIAELVATHGLEPAPEFDEPSSRFVVRGRIEQPPLPPGFGLESLEDNNDLAQINRVLWRGFNHDGPAPVEGVEWRRRAQQAPNFNKALTMIVVAPNGDHVSFAGMWFDPVNRIGYVEPVATDPDYRRMGLGAAAVLASMQRVAVLGAEIIWVGSDQEFYKSLGFETTCRNVFFLKDL